jgi:hypothetical protein
MTMFNGIDTDKATLIASQKKPDRGGYRHSLYRAEDGRLFIRGVHEENQKLPLSMRRATTTLMETKEDHARKWLVWNGYPELVERVFPEIHESQASVSILKSGPIPGADRRENAGGGPPDPDKAAGKVSGGISPGQAGKKTEETVESPIIRNAIKRTKAPGSVSVHDIRDDESPLVKNALHRRGAGENAPGQGGTMPEGTGENPVLRDAERRRETAGSASSTDGGGNPLVRDALRRTRAEGSASEDEEKKPEETGDEKKPEKDDEANQDQGEKESEKTDQAASGEEDKDPEKAEEDAVVRDAIRRIMSLIRFQVN